MKAQFDIQDILKEGQINNELDLERALIADRKLRVLAKEQPEFKEERQQLRTIIQAYENAHWNKDILISDQQLKESDLAEYIAEQERLFVAQRKKMIKTKLKNIGLTQQQLGEILGHTSKSYMSELINGVSPFSLKDLIVINRLFDIDLTDLVPTFLAHEDRLKIKETLQKLSISNLKLKADDFELEAC